MHFRTAVASIVAASLGACGYGAEPTAPAPPPPSAQLKEILVANLPSPYYHFEYDAAGRIVLASFASGFFVYDVTYANGRIVQMANNALGNTDRLVYSYDAAGRVDAISYVDANGQVSANVRLSYAGQQLTSIVWMRRLNADLVPSKTMSFSYYPDGNLLEIVDHRPAVAGLQDETTSIDRFEQYDDGINVDGFSLIHNDFFDHLFLLPGVRLQTGNPGRETLTGDGENYRVDYVYAYDADRRPLSKTGTLVITNGANAGQTIQTQSLFTY
jgi:hypothetical protein